MIIQSEPYQWVVFLSYTQHRSGLFMKRRILPPESFPVAQPARPGLRGPASVRTPSSVYPIRVVFPPCPDDTGCEISVTELTA